MSLPTRRARIAAVAVTCLLVGAACSSDDKSSSGDDGTTSAPATTEATAGGERVCEQGAITDDVVAEPVADIASDFTLTSFDGTEIRGHWFPTRSADSDEGAPTVLMGPGWSLSGDTSQDGAALFGALGIGPLNANGYNVLTWDPRGFGASTGTVQVNDPEAEGQDVRVLIDWVASQPGVQLDGEGDPRMGMVGFSYGGGIQLTVAGMDCRVDAIVPGIAWNSLETSLYKAETMKQGWAELLLQTAVGRDLDPHIQSAADDGLATGVLTEEDEEWFRGRGPADLVDDITVPTLLVQGTVDNLFTLDEAIANYEVLRSSDVPTAMVWFCGGHGACLTDRGDLDLVSDATFAWLDRYVKGDESVDVGPGFRFTDQDGTTWSADEYAPGADSTITASGSGELLLTAEGGSGPNSVEAAAGDPLAGLVTDITPAIAVNAVDVPIEVTDAEGVALGAPRLEVTYSADPVAGAECDRPARLFAQLVDDERGVVVGNMVTPFAIEVDGQSHETTVDLEVIAQRVSPGDELTLQIVAATTAYAVGCTGPTVKLEAISITLPVAEGLTEA